MSRNLLDAIHTDLIEQYGGWHGVNDERLIESVLVRRKNARGYRPESAIIALAALLAFRLTKNRGYRDGNKRTAFVAAAVFLWLNGYRLVASETEAVSAMVYLATDTWSEARFAEWVGERVDLIGPTAR